MYVIAMIMFYYDCYHGNCCYDKIHEIAKAIVASDIHVCDVSFLG